MTRLRRYFSLHRGLTIAVASTALLALGAGAAYAAVSSGSSGAPAATSSTTPTTMPATAPAAASASGAATAKAHHRMLLGKVTAISGNTWTVESRAGTAITVNITTATRFGTKAAPSSQSNFAVGDAVGVVGPRTAPTTVTAKRIVQVRPGRVNATTPTTAGASTD